MSWIVVFGFKIALNLTLSTYIHLRLILDAVPTTGGTLLEWELSARFKWELDLSAVLADYHTSTNTNIPRSFRFHKDT